MTPPKTLDLKVNTLEVNYKNMFKQNTDEHREINNSLNNVNITLGNLISKMDERYASKWVERALLFLFVCAGTAIIGLIVRWVIFLELKP